MEQPFHEHREPPPPLPEPERVEPRDRWPVWKHLVLAGVLVVVSIAAILTPLYVLATWPRPQAETVSHLFQMHWKMYNATLEGATIDEALELARAEGFDTSVAGSTIRVNPDEDVWAGRNLPEKAEDAPVMLIADRLFDDCIMLPEGNGRSGYYGYSAAWTPRFIPEGELPDWARR